MKSTWITAALLSSALVVGCGDRESENTQNSGQNEGTSVAIAPEPGDQASLQPPASAPPAPSQNRDSAAVRPDSSGSRSTTGNRAPARPAPVVRETAPLAPERLESSAPRVSTAPPRVTVRTLTIPAGTSLPLELTTAVDRKSVVEGKRAGG